MEDNEQVYKVEVYNGYYIKDYLKENKFFWDSDFKRWYKYTNAEETKELITFLHDNRVNRVRINISVYFIDSYQTN